MFQTNVNTLTETVANSPLIKIANCWRLKHFYSFFFFGIGDMIDLNPFNLFTDWTIKITTYLFKFKWENENHLHHILPFSLIATSGWTIKICSRPICAIWLSIVPDTQTKNILNMVILFSDSLSFTKPNLCDPFFFTVRIFLHAACNLTLYLS